MNERKQLTPEELAAWQANFDAHIITPDEYEEIPETTDDWFARAKPHIGGREVSWEEWRESAIKHGWPISPEISIISFRVDTDVVEHFRAAGDGWQERMNAALRKAAGLPDTKVKRAS